jgi:hypothetical protein
MDTHKRHEIFQDQPSEGQEVAAMPCRTADAGQKLDTVDFGDIDQEEVGPLDKEHELDDDEIESLFENRVSPQIAS